MQYEKIENDDGHQPIRIAFEDDDLKLGKSIVMFKMEEQ